MTIAKEINILVIEDSQSDALLINHALRDGGLLFRSKIVSCREELLEELSKGSPDLVLSDHGLPDCEGITALALVRKTHPDLPFLFVSGSVENEVAVDSIKAGATDYIRKDRLSDLVPAIHRALVLAHERSARLSAEQALHHAEVRLRKSEGWNAAILEAAFDAIVVIDSNLCVTEWNSMAERMFGYSVSDARGMPIDGLILPRFQRELFREQRFQCMTTGVGSPIELSACRANGEELPVEFVITPIPSNAPPLYTLIIRDISLRKEAETENRRLHAQLEQRVRDRTAELEIAIHELESFSSSVSHDLRAPLRHISGFTKMLIKDSSDRLDERGRELLENIALSASRMLDLIDALLAFAQLGQAELRKSPVELANVVSVARAKVIAEEDAHGAAWDIAPLPTVEGDAALLQQVFINLLSNALKFTRKQPNASIQIGAMEETDRVVCFVRDNGIGFDTQYSGKMFEVFQRIHSGGDFEGIGMGLAIVQLIINRHGGQAWAEGAVNKGTTIYFSLPHPETNGTKNE